MSRYKVDMNNFSEEEKNKMKEFDSQFPMFNNYVVRNEESTTQLIREFRDVAEKHNLESKEKSISFEDSLVRAVSIYSAWVALLDCIDEEYSYIYKVTEMIRDDYNNQGLGLPTIEQTLEVFEEKKEAYTKKYGTHD